MGVEINNNDLEQQEKIKSDFINDLLNNSDNLEGKNGKEVLSAIEDDIRSKSKSINDEGTERQIEGFNKYTQLGKLTLDQAQELGEIYKEINSILGTEVKENNIQNEQAKEKSEKDGKDYSQRLL